MAASLISMTTTVSSLTNTSTPSRKSLKPRFNFSVVRCMSQPPSESDSTAPPKTPATLPLSSSPPPPATLPLSSPPPPPAPKVSTKFSDVLAFSGPAPERINGRLAMIGFVSAMAVELSSGQDVFSQISNGGVSVFVGTSLLLTLASLVPLFKGVRAEAKSSGLMTSDAEMWNGRFAMLGLVALAVTEFVKGSALV